jgi:hypothetical protein
MDSSTKSAMHFWVALPRVSDPPSRFASEAEGTAKCYTPPVAFCRVGYRDIEGIEHQVEVEAQTLFEAVARAVERFRSGSWDGHAPGPGCQFRVEVMPAPPVAYTVSLNKVEEFARYGAVRGPQDILRKERLRQLLGIVS